MELIQTKPVGTIDKIFDIDCVSNADERQKQIDSAVARNLPIVQFSRIKRKGKLAIVATGPSVTDYADTLREWDGEVWAINGAMMWMRKRGFTPDAFIGIDPEWFLKEYLVDPPDITYYLAAQVHPQVFDHLEGKNVQLWFQSDREVKLPLGVNTIPGGSSCLGRAPYLGCFLGWTDVHLFGGDSSFSNQTHVTGGEIPANFIFAQAGGETFKTTRTFMAQACELAEIVQNFPGTITVHGRGLMQSMCDDIKKSGVAEYLAEQEALELKQYNRKQRRAMKLGRVA